MNPRMISPHVQMDLSRAGEPIDIDLSSEIEDPVVVRTYSEFGDPIARRLRRVRRRRRLRSLLLSLVATAVVIFVLFRLVLAIAVVEGSSMTPALQDGDVAVFLRLGASYKTGDIVLVETDDGTEQVKRIVALPGQTVDIDNETGTLFVDEEELLEAYIYEETYTGRLIGYPIELDDDEYFVLGDNRINSRDSRNYGAVSADQLKAKLLFLAFRWEA